MKCFLLLYCSAGLWTAELLAGFTPIPGLTTALTMARAVSTITDGVFLGIGAVVGAIGRKKRGSDAPLTQLDYSGWVTQYTKPYKGIYTRMSHEMFVGFGNCPSQSNSVSNTEDLGYKNADDQSKFINFILLSLRADCLPFMKTVVEELVDIGIISFSLEKKSFEINPEHGYL
jgi:hypothetical protein